MGPPMSPVPDRSSVNLPPRRGQVRSAIRAGATTREELEQHMRAGRLPPAELEKELAALGKDRFQPLRSEWEREQLPRPERVRHDEEGGDTVKVGTAEYEMLTSVARLTRVFMPLLEGCGAPVQRPTEWNMLREKLKMLERAGVTLSAASTDAVIGLLNAQRLLADDE